MQVVAHACAITIEDRTLVISREFVFISWKTLERNPFIEAMPSTKGLLEERKGSTGAEAGFWEAGHERYINVHSRVVVAEYLQGGRWDPANGHVCE